MPMTWHLIDSTEHPAPRDGTWIDVRSRERKQVFRMYWWPEGTSWNADCTELVQTGVWTDDDGWLQPNEVTHWRPPPPKDEG